MSCKRHCALVKSSPIIILQLALFVYMSIVGIDVTFTAFDNDMVVYSYAIGIIYTLLLAVVSIFKTFGTDPGHVSAALIEKLKSQLLLPRNIEKMEHMRSEDCKREYLLKCLNSSIAKHIARRPNNALNQYAHCIEEDMELLDL